ncbi:MAG: PQQ-dependent sugar dehydrogenase, partial [Nannocystaceae bacterium]|nr:PQQ-dependent sugar dehydrogenase [Nannocystaceae bacterium]
MKLSMSHAQLAVVLGCVLAPGCKASAPSSASDPTDSVTSTVDATASPDSDTNHDDASEDDDGDDDAGGGSLALSFVEIDVAGGLSLTTEFRFLPGTMEFLALSKSGRVDHYALSGEQAQHLGGFQLPGAYSDLDCGLLSLAFDPQFARNRFLYLGTCISVTHSAIYRVTFDATAYDDIGSSRAEILIQGDPEAPKPWHNIGQIGFDEDGYLWALLGDKRVSANGQDVSNDLASLILIEPNREPDGVGHQPAPDGPWANEPDASANLRAIGLRSPWRGLLDAEHRYWFGDVGANGFEEINIVSQPGQNFGWPTHQGPREEDCAGFTDPVVSWAHEGTHPYQLDDPDVSSTNARVAWVGLQYMAEGGDQYDGALTGTVLFGDYCLGFVRGLDVDGNGTVVSDRHLGHLRFPTAWNEGTDGFIYVSTFGKCETAGLDDADPP